MGESEEKVCTEVGQREEDLRIGICSSGSCIHFCLLPLRQGSEVKVPHDLRRNSPGLRMVCALALHSSVPHCHSQLPTKSFCFFSRGGSCSQPILSISFDVVPPFTHPRNQFYSFLDYNLFSSAFSCQIYLNHHFCIKIPAWQGDLKEGGPNLFVWSPGFLFRSLSLSLCDLCMLFLS